MRQRRRTAVRMLRDGGNLVRPLTATFSNGWRRAIAWEGARDGKLGMMSCDVPLYCNLQASLISE